jgi:hypothetical protein
MSPDTRQEQSRGVLLNYIETTPCGTSNCRWEPIKITVSPSTTRCSETNQLQGLGHRLDSQTLLNHRVDSQARLTDFSKSQTRLTG